AFDPPIDLGSITAGFDRLHRWHPARRLGSAHAGCTTARRAAAFLRQDPVGRPCPDIHTANLRAHRTLRWLDTGITDGVVTVGPVAERGWQVWHERGHATCSRFIGGN